MIISIANTLSDDQVEAIIEIVKRACDAVVGSSKTGILDELGEADTIRAHFGGPDDFTPETINRLMPLLVHVSGIALIASEADFDA